MFVHLPRFVGIARVPCRSLLYSSTATVLSFSSGAIPLRSARILSSGQAQSHFPLGYVAGALGLVACVSLAISLADPTPLPCVGPRRRGGFPSPFQASADTYKRGAQSDTPADHVIDLRMVPLPYGRPCRWLAAAAQIRASANRAWILPPIELYPHHRPDDLCQECSRRRV